MAEFVCWTCGEETEYEGDGYWYCPKCNESFFEGYDEDGESVGESLSVDEAAAIWASNGKDEDYTFGYSEEELEDAL